MGVFRAKGKEKGIEKLVHKMEDNIYVPSNQEKHLPSEISKKKTEKDRKKTKIRYVFQQTDKTKTDKNEQ